MKMAQLIIGGMGAFYIILGGGIAITFLATGLPMNAVAIPMLFVVLGICFLIGCAIPSIRRNAVIKKGTRYAAKIYSYVDNTSYTVNGKFTSNAKVHYFDQNGIEREAIIPTAFSKGSNGMYPIGMTIDIYEYNGRYGFDPKSVRNERLPREAELMDDKPINPEEMTIVAHECENCGATFEALAGYSNKCPYCGSYLNV